MLTYTSRFLLNALLGKTTWPGSHDRGIMDAIGEKPVAAQSTRDIIAIRRVRDQIDREYAQPLNVEGLARDAYMSAGHLSREFRRIYQESPYSSLMRSEDRCVGTE